MTNRPSRASTSGRRYLDLRKLARAIGRPTDELLQLYALEGFLDRLQRSTSSRSLVLKGGVLLAAYDARRPTRDIDFAATTIVKDVGVIRDVVCDVLRVAVDDGLDFNAATTTAEAIRENDRYGGVRVTVEVHVASAQLRFHIDVNMGDPIWPGPIEIDLPRLLGGEPLRIIGYPVAMVLAEKIVTAIQRGTANTRWRDFVDVARLSHATLSDAQEIRGAILRIAAHRQVQLRPLSEVLEGFGPLAQSRWAAWRRRQRLAETTPESFDDLLSNVIEISDPLLCQRK